MTRRGDAAADAVTLLRTDRDWLVELLLELLAIPSPSGYTEAALVRVEAALAELGLVGRRTPKGALLWTLAGAGGGDRHGPVSVVSHIDTLGAMVKEIKKNGRLKLSPIGGYDWATVEGAECTVHTFSGGVLTGTVVNTKQSTHVFGPELRKLSRSAEVMELRLDAPTRDRATTRALGVEVGDVVAFDSRPRLSEHGYVKGRHLDNKASVAVSLAVSKAFVDAGRQPARDVHFFVSNYEEVGHGAAVGIPPETVDLICVDMAAVGEGQASDEHSVTLCVKDSTGPYDPGLSGELRRLADARGIPLKVDIYPYFGSDASAAWRAGGSYRAALIGPGVDASHAYERTHAEALEATSALLLAYLEGSET